MTSSMDVDFVLVSDDEDEDQSDDDESDPYVEEEEEEDDSDSDPTFDLDATDKAFSSLSVNKTKPRIADKQGVEEGDSKSSEAVEKLIKDGKLDKLKIDHCKVYLKQHGLRLTGKKDVLLNRIKEHLELKDGSGEKKYPVSSFTLNCQGDACMGDVVVFEQTVYEMFNIGSRSATGPPIGKRTVVGRIVHESYGEAKQQHTFTIEVLWSKGKKPWPPLHPLCIKGRNLYKFKTMRQKWDNEEERMKILQEKHNRGHVARLSRERRIQEKELKKEKRENRKKEKSRVVRSTQQPTSNFHDVTNLPHHEQHPHCNFDRGMHPQIIQRHTATGILGSGSKSRWKAMHPPQTVQNNPQMRPSYSTAYYPNTGYSYQQSNIYNNKYNRHVNHGYNERMYAPPVPTQQHGYNNNGRMYVPPVLTQQWCRYYLQGRCRYGRDCKFMHE